jgi:hypothetical protein
MTDTTPKKANGFIPPIFAKAKMLAELNSKVLAYLDESLKNTCQVANLSANRLTLLVSSGSVATQLRFLIPDLLRHFKQDEHLKNISDIQCKVRPPQSSRRSRRKEPTVASLSTETANIVRSIAESIDDSKIREVLKRIAAHTKSAKLPPK